MTLDKAGAPFGTCAAEEAERYALIQCIGQALCADRATVAQLSGLSFCRRIQREEEFSIGTLAGCGQNPPAITTVSGYHWLHSNSQVFSVGIPSA
ncbi:hypothetical protein OG430_42290 [Streptomyces sp. NBC_01304]|nr:hypothetical protein OG430_42290 [Streptomyces sp. NBC_01304]